MAKSQVQLIIDFLKNNADTRFSARQIAVALTQNHADFYQNKRNNPRFAQDENLFLSQVVAEIGAAKKLIINQAPKIRWQDKPRPRVYWYESAYNENSSDELADETTNSFSEHDLYQPLMKYLYEELNLYCQRIDDKCSRNRAGKGGNHWLHPDIVAMQTVDENWCELTQKINQAAGGQRVRLWSFEVKKSLSVRNTRESFFQAVSNSSWANEGYLVAAQIDSQVDAELRMLSALHGIGVILLNLDNPNESDIILPAKARSEVDWESVNRIIIENSDFSYFIELVSHYFVGVLKPKEWNSMPK